VQTSGAVKGPIFGAVYVVGAIKIKRFKFKINNLNYNFCKDDDQNIMIDQNITYISIL
jgi:hypothetical protein